MRTQRHHNQAVKQFRTSNSCATSFMAQLQVNSSLRPTGLRGTTDVRHDRCGLWQHAPPTPCRPNRMVGQADPAGTRAVTRCYAGATLQAHSQPHLGDTAAHGRKLPPRYLPSRADCLPALPLSAAARADVRGLMFLHVDVSLGITQAETMHIAPKSGDFRSAASRYSDSVRKHGHRI